MTQRDLSRLTGYSMRLIGEVERGKEHVAADKLLAILGAAGCVLDVSPLEGAQRDDWQNSSQDAPVARVNLEDWCGYPLDETLFNRVEGME